MIGGLACAVVLFALRLVGAARARRRVAGDPLAAARERDLAGPQHRRGARARSATPTTRSGSRSIPRRPRSCGSSASPAGRSIASSIAARACTRCSTKRRGCARSRWLWSVLLVVGANVLVFWSLATAALNGRLTLAEVVMFAQSAVGASLIAFGGLNWALDGAAAPVAAVLRLEPAMASRRRAAAPAPSLRHGMPAGKSASATSRSRIPAARRSSITSISRFPPDPRSPSSGRTAPARRRSPSCCAGCTTRSRARSRSTASICATCRSSRGAAASPPCSRTSSASSCRCATTSRPPARPTTWCTAALAAAGAANLASLDTVLARGYDGGTDLSGGQWQRVALARALCAVAARRRPRAARRADRAARRPRRSGDLRSHPRRDAALHDDPHLAPLLDGAPRRPHLRARTGPRHRARHARRADGAGAAATARCSICRRSASPRPPKTRRGRPMTSSAERADGRIRSRCRRRCRRCGGCASSATATSRG